MLYCGLLNDIITRIYFYPILPISFLPISEMTRIERSTPATRYQKLVGNAGFFKQRRSSDGSYAAGRAMDIRERIKDRKTRSVRRTENTRQRLEQIFYA
jgi:hypothetical protein